MNRNLQYNMCALDSHDCPWGGNLDQEIDLHGMDAEEAIFRLDLYLNEAFVAGLPWVRVVHGKGMGTLRHVTRELLANHPLVQSFRPGEPAEGGGGATVVELANR